MKSFKDKDDELERVNVAVSVPLHEKFMPSYEPVAEPLPFRFIVLVSSLIVPVAV